MYKSLDRFRDLVYLQFANAVPLFRGKLKKTQKNLTKKGKKLKNPIKIQIPENGEKTNGKWAKS